MHFLFSIYLKCLSLHLHFLASACPCIFILYPFCFLMISLFLFGCTSKYSVYPSWHPLYHLCLLPSLLSLFLFLILPPQYIKMPFILFNESNWKFGCYLHRQDLMFLSKTEHMSMLLDAWCYYSELIGNASHLGGIYSNLGLFLWSLITHNIFVLYIERNS